jgi:hypothetical protein
LPLVDYGRRKQWKLLSGDQNTADRKGFSPPSTKGELGIAHSTHTHRLLEGIAQQILSIANIASGGYSVGRGPAVSNIFRGFVYL